MAMKATGGNGINTNQHSTDCKALWRGAAVDQQEDDLPIREIVQALPVETFRKQIDSIYRALGEEIRQIYRLDVEAIRDEWQERLEAVQTLTGGINAGARMIMARRIVEQQETKE